MMIQLEQYYRTRLPDAVVSECRSITDGWETEMHRFVLEAGNRRRERIVRMYPGENAVAKAQHEFTVLQKLHEQGYPVPKVYELETDSRPLGKPFITIERIDGLPAGALVTQENQGEMLSQFCELLVKLHQLDIHPFLPADVSAAHPADPLWFVRRVEEFLDHRITPDLQVYFAPLGDWLRENSVPASHYSLLHSDFHCNNILITAAGEPFVIDWGTSLIGDYRFDLAWTLLLASTRGEPWSRTMILKMYEVIQGAPVTDIAYFEVCAAFRRLSDMVMSLTQGAEKQGLRPETADIMRQKLPHYEKVYRWLLDRTGLRLPALEHLLASLR